MKGAIDIASLCYQIATQVLDEDSRGNMKYWSQMKEQSILPFSLADISVSDLTMFLGTKVNKKLTKMHPLEHNELKNGGAVHCHFVNLICSYLANILHLQIWLYKGYLNEADRIDPSLPILLEVPLGIMWSAESGKFSICNPWKESPLKDDVRVKDELALSDTSDEDISIDVDIQVHNDIKKVQEFVPNEDSGEWEHVYGQIKSIGSAFLSHATKLNEHVVSKIGTCTGACPECCMKRWSSQVKNCRGAKKKTVSKTSDLPKKSMKK